MVALSDVAGSDVADMSDAHVTEDGNDTRALTLEDDGTGVALTRNEEAWIWQVLLFALLIRVSRNGAEEDEVPSETSSVPLLLYINAVGKKHTFTKGQKLSAVIRCSPL